MSFLRIQISRMLRMWLITRIKCLCRFFCWPSLGLEDPRFVFNWLRNWILSILIFLKGCRRCLIRSRSLRKTLKWMRRAILRSIWMPLKRSWLLVWRREGLFRIRFWLRCWIGSFRNMKLLSTKALFLNSPWNKKLQSIGSIRFTSAKSRFQEFNAAISLTSSIFSKPTKMS